MGDRKNYAIEWYRYFFAFFICTLHFKEYFGDPYPFGGAYLAVEFFFIVSGFFLMQSIDRQKGGTEGLGLERGTAAFFVKKFKHLYPQYILSWALLAAYSVLSRHSLTIRDILVDHPAEIFMLQILGAGKRLNPAMWYVSALLFVSVVVYYLANKNRKRFVYAIAPVCTVLIYSYLYQTVGALGGVGWKNLLIVREGFWRGLAGICLGCIVYEAYTKLDAAAQRRFPILRTVYEVGTLCLLSVMFYRPGNTAADFTLTAMMALLVLSAMCSGPDSGGYLSRLLCRVKIDGRYAYAIYCGHWLINCIVRDHFPGYPFYPALAVYLIVTVAVSVCTTKLIELTTSPLGGGGGVKEAVGCLSYSV